ncbi:HET-domain-containing protein [Rhizodiscina lignyota]|uniref:HET-domain-containing protein n=1 Tax=Rhizodiscina lignyota TaxID=1504668 RepID=A0A9P4I6S1_9PEZI|nr:HET-domain-containing protein [Rhizodiscina lignyota]
MGWDDGSWSKWMEPGQNGRTYHVCHHCLWSPRSYWNDLFSLCQKSGVGTTHIPRSQQSIAFEMEELFITSHQQPEDISGAEQYQKFTDPFEHSPLDHDQIRLLSLLPGGDDICCTIEKADLNSAAAQYEALSYSWRSNKQSKHTIWINSHPFEVSWNLYDALTQLRKPTSTRKLWIDAICINQVGDDGKAEKNTQIPLMGRIYHQAVRVIVWLGAAKDGSDETLDIIAQQNVEAMQTRKFAMDFGQLLKRPWFRRTWVVQEFVLGKALPQILCGSRTVSYGKFMATHWVLPMLKDRIPGMDFNQLWKIVDSSGNVVSSKVFTRKSATVWINHDEAEKTLANLINIRRAIVDDEGRLRPRPLYKVLPFIKDFDATDLKDKIYGTFGIVSPSVHQSVQVSYDKSVAEVYRDAMTYMLRQGKDEPGAVDLYLEYPLSLSLDMPTPGLPSWVPDFSQNSPFLCDHEDITWYWLYHQNSTLGGHTPLLRKQHGRHTVNRDAIDRRLLSVNDARLSVRGFLVDEVDAVVESTFFGLTREMRDYSERQMKSSSEESQDEGSQIKSWLDIHAKTKDETIPELTTQADDPSMFFASTLTQRYKIRSLYLVNELCRTKFPTTGRSLDPESWLTFIWRDLLEGYSALTNVSEEELDEQFYDLAQSEKSITGSAWLSNVLKGEARTVGKLPQLNIPIGHLFGPQRTFFTTKTSGFYGVSPPRVQEGDKLAFLFPQAYMAFILRPSGENFRMVGPCIVPPRLRDRALEKLHSPTYEGDEIVII